MRDATATHANVNDRVTTLTTYVNNTWLPVAASQLLVENE